MRIKNYTGKDGTKVTVTTLDVPINDDGDYLKYDVNGAMFTNIDSAYNYARMIGGGQIYIKP